RYMLDTNMCIYLMKNQPEQFARRFASCYVWDVVMSAITFAELEYGVSASDDPERELDNLTALARERCTGRMRSSSPMRSISNSTSVRSNASSA
ncbi:PIN domain-containing protein, partial [Rhizobium johnstonii]